MRRRVKFASAAALAAALIAIGGAAGSAGAGSTPPPPSPNLERLANAVGAPDGQLATLDTSLQLIAANEALGRPLWTDAQVLDSATEAGSGGQLIQGTGAMLSPAGDVLVDIYVDGSLDAVQRDLRGLGMRVRAVNPIEPQRLVEGWLPADALVDATGLAGVQALVAIPADQTNAGSVLSQGDAAHNGPAARALGPTGAGVKVGVISNSINRAGGGVAGSQGTGDLPANVQILQEGPAGSNDEGRAMAEIVYDTAPGITDMAFTTGSLGAATRATGIDNLVAAGAKVIADDTFQITEPFFQDGVIAQAVDRAQAAGVTYLVSAGNRARQSWEGTYAPTTDPSAVSPSANDFDPGAGADAIQTLGTYTNRTIFLALQWDEPFGGATTDLAIDVWDIVAGTPNFAFAVDTNNLATGLPSEVANISVAGTHTIGISIRRVAGTRSPFMKYILGGVPAGPIAEYATNSNAIDPDASSAKGALTVAASNFATPATPEGFSSRGPTVTKLFDTAGNRLDTPDVRAKPDLAAADGVATSVAGFNPFFGTSAAAPSAAGIATLMRSGNPNLSERFTRAILTNPANTIDCTETAGQPDADCGAGFILANRAVAQALDTTPPVISPVLDPPAPNANGFYNGDVSVSWNVSDPESPVADPTGCGPTTVTTNGTTDLTCSATSVGGTGSNTATIKRDTTSPAISPVLNPATPNGANGFYTGAVAVSWNVTDPDSPIFDRTGCDPTAVTTDGTAALTCNATSGGGPGSGTATIKRDASPPAKPKFSGIKSKTYKKKKAPKKKKVGCDSSDPTSGVLDCEVTGYKRSPGRHKITATATNGAGLTSESTLKYKIRRG